MANEKFEIDVAHSSVEFTVRHLVVAKVRGHFTKYAGTIEFDADQPTSAKVDVDIEAASIDTRDAKRDGHLKSPDFFDAEKFPTLSFHSKRVEKAGSGLKVVGDLTIHGVTKEVALEAAFEGRAKDPWGGERVAFGAKTKIDRREFGLNWNTALEAGGVLVGENVDIALEVEAKKV